MKKIVYISGLVTLLSLCLTVISVLHISFLKGNASDTVKLINESFVNHNSLTKDESRKLKGSLNRLEGGERYLLELHKSLWRFSVIGFALITLLSGFVTVQAYQANPSFKRDA